MGLRLSFLLIALLVTGGCSKQQYIAEPLVVSTALTPSALYADSLSRLKPILVTGTKVIREDFENGLIFRFSTLAPESDGVKLVEIKATQGINGATIVRIESQDFAFTKAKRDKVDEQTEQDVWNLLK